jgi:hypothetical protein
MAAGGPMHDNDRLGLVSGGGTWLLTPGRSLVMRGTASPQRCMNAQRALIWLWLTWPRALDFVSPPHVKSIRHRGQSFACVIDFQKIPSMSSKLITIPSIASKYSFPLMLSNLDFNSLNVITVSLKLTPLVIFKANPYNATKIYTDSFNATRNWFDLFGFKNFRIEKILNPKFLKRKYTTLILKFISLYYH